MTSTELPASGAAVFRGYAPPGEERPLGSYALLSGVFTAALAGAIAAKRDDLPERISAADLALLGVGTHKLSRLIAKDKVTSVVRAPFARYEGDAGPSEVSEAPRGRGMRYAIGELITCPYCIGQWVAAGGVVGLAVAPRVTRFVAGLFTVVAISDGLQIAYHAGQEKAQ
jgi:hypothetical protein